MSPAPHRLARACVVAASATVLGAAGHALAGGDVPPLGVLVAVLALIGPAWLLAGRERGWIPVAAAQLAGQQAVHAGLEATGGMSSGMSGGLVPHDLMLQLHVVAAVLVAGWLRRGEQRTWEVARRAARAVTAWLLRALAVRPRPAVARPAPARTPALLAPATAVLRHTLGRRGPPQAA